MGSLFAVQGHCLVVEGCDNRPFASVFDKPDAGRHLGPHASGWKMPCRQVLLRLMDMEASKSFLSFFSEVKIDFVHIGEDHEDVSTNGFSEFLSCKVLIDNRFHSAYMSVSIKNNRDSPPARGYDNDTRFKKLFDHFGFENPERVRGWNDATVAL